jgi:large subunit ribosomal protein L37Ae
MAKRTKKVGPTGRFGPRYGVRSRVRWRDVETRQKQWHTCPHCGHAKVKRLSTAIWECRKCASKFTGGAYTPRTAAALGVDKSIAGVLEKVRGEAAERAEEERLLSEDDSKAEEEA